MVAVDPELVEELIPRQDTPRSRVESGASDEKRRIMSHNTEERIYEQRKAACKPSSVPGPRLVYVPTSRDFVPMAGRAATIYLGRTLPSGSSGQPGDGPGALSPSIRPCSRCGLPGSRYYYRDGELLPRHFTLTPIRHRGGMFLWHFPSGHPAPPLAGILPGGARTFLRPPSPQPPNDDGKREGRRSPSRLAPPQL